MKTEEISPELQSRLKKERRYRVGMAHRKAGLPCRFNDGPYLNGWYAETPDFYYITKDEAHLL